MKIYEIISYNNPHVLNEVLFRLIGYGVTAIGNSLRFSKVNTQAVRRLKHLDKRIKVYDKRLAPHIVTLYGAIGISEIYQLWNEYSVIDALYEAGEISEEERDYRKKLALGNFMVEVFTPSIAARLASKAKLTKLFSELLVKAGGKTKWPAMARVLEEPALFAIVYALLQSPMGKEYITNPVSKFVSLVLPTPEQVDTVLGITKKSVDILIDYASKKIDASSNGETYKPPEFKQTDPELLKTYGAVSNFTGGSSVPLIQRQFGEVLLNGVQITEKGYLDPDRLGSTEVQVARKIIINKGGPDPFKTIPRDPNKTYNEKYFSLKA